MKNQISTLLFVLFELLFSNYSYYGQCANTCGSNLIQNLGFETPSALCGILSAELILSPNPSSRGFQILNSTINQIVYIFDDIGQLVYSKKIITENEFLNIPELSNGLYIIKILDVNGNYFEKKLIKNDEIIFDNKWGKY
jgi:hypothetical protein